MAQLSDFYPEVLADVPNCPRPVVKNAILNALVEFCKRSRFWVIDLDPVDIVAGTAEYAVTSNVTNAVVHDLYHVEAFGHPLDSTSRDQLNREWPNFTRKYTSWNSELSSPWAEYESDQPRVFYQPSRSKIRLVGIPTVSGTGALVMSAAVFPGPSIANEIAAEIHDEYREVIGFGAKARLFVQPEKAWSAPTAVQAQYGMFEAGIADAAAKRARDFARDNKTVHRTRSYY